MQKNEEGKKEAGRKGRREGGMGREGKGKREEKEIIKPKDKLQTGKRFAILLQIKS